MEFKDYYKILGVGSDADEATIKREFRKLARKYHPDLNKGDAAAETRFKEVNEANEVLGDPEKRKKYDELRRYREVYGEGPGAGQWADGDPFGGFHDFRAERGNGDGTWHFYTGGAPFSTGGGTDGGPGDFSEFFEQFFGEPRPGSGAFRGTGGVFRGADQKSSMPVRLEDCYHGGERVFELDGETIRVKIPRGFPADGTLKLSGRGRPGVGGGPRGDLYLKLIPEKHERFERRENDLYYDCPVDLFSMLLGGEKNIQTLHGRVKLSVPPESQNGDVLRLKGIGMPLFGRENEYGDLYVRLVARLPRNLNEAEREALRELARGRESESRATKNE